MRREADLRRVLADNGKIETGLNFVIVFVALQVAAKIGVEANSQKCREEKLRTRYQLSEVVALRV